MINLYPIVHKVACASCGGLTTLPIDILQTKVLILQRKLEREFLQNIILLNFQKM